MRNRILSQTRFEGPGDGWQFLQANGISGAMVSPQRGGCRVAADGGQEVHFDGLGVHARNGDSIEVQFELLTPNRGALRFGFHGGAERAEVRLDFKRKIASLLSTDWTRPQSPPAEPFKLARGPLHTLRLEKTEGGGRLVKMANLRVQLDEQTLLAVDDLNVLPEMGVDLRVAGTELWLRRFVHRGVPSGVPQRLHAGGWQMPNVNDIEANLASIFRGLRAAAAAGVRLLVTPETSLTGLFASDAVTRRQAPVAEAERKVRRFIRDLPGAPFLVVGLPLWENAAGHRRRQTRYNAARVYDPDGDVVFTGRKIHSCETDFWHGYQLNEFEIDGAPIAMHICHDGRYPDVFTLPIMFGARLVVQPCNGGTHPLSVEAFEAECTQSTRTTHAFYLQVDGGGHSCLVSPHKYDNLIAMPPECRRDNPAFPMTGPPREGLFSANIALHEAFGYWPVRSFRASEAAAEAYVDLYRARGGRRLDGN